MTPTLRGVVPRQRSALILQHWPDIDSELGDRAWAAIRDQRWKYIEHDEGWRELYDLDTDPFELRSLHASPSFSHQTRMTALAEELHRRMGLTMKTLALPRCSGWTALRANARGGRWAGAVSLAAIGRGVADRDDARPRRPSAGTPTAAGVYEVWVQVVDDSVRLHAGGPQSFVRALSIEVVP